MLFCKKLVDKIKGVKEKQLDEKIQCLLLKIAKANKEMTRYKTFWLNSREAFLLLRIEMDDDVLIGNILDANPSACSLYGYTMEEITKLTIMDLTAEPEGTRQTYSSKTEFVPFRYHKNKDGTKFLINASLTYFQDNGNGEVAALIIRPVAEHRSKNGTPKDRQA
jgi:PAS domain S-box-containing protein